MVVHETNIAAEVLFNQISVSYEAAYGNNLGLTKAFARLRLSQDIGSSSWMLAVAPAAQRHVLLRLDSASLGLTYLSI